MILKVLAAICVAISFLVSIILFTGFGSQFIQPSIALIVFLSSGGIALFLNLFSYKIGKHDPRFNFYFWLACVIVFVLLTCVILVVREELPSKSF